tara:strand:+ start:13912 stop:14331 length:420 start_codon:yes stop_codon:yes gene_type:complete
MKVDQWKIGYMRNLLEGKVNHGYEVSLLRTKISSIIGELEKLQEYDIDVPDEKLAAMFASVNDKITSMKEEASNISHFDDVNEEVGKLKDVVEPPPEPEPEPEPVEEEVLTEDGRVVDEPTEDDPIPEAPTPEEGTEGE